MSGSLIKYIKKLEIEYEVCLKNHYQYELNESYKYFYYLDKAIYIKKIINDLSDIIIDKDLNFITTKRIVRMLDYFEKKEND